METISGIDGLVAQAFRNGYHSERLPTTTHTIHDLNIDAAHIASDLNQNLNGKKIDNEALRDALVYGVQAKPYPEVEETLDSLSKKGDTILIWTLGEPSVQLSKVRSLGWEGQFRNPDDPGNFVVYPSKSKLNLLQRIVSYSRNVRRNSSIFIADDKQLNLIEASRTLNDLGHQDDIHYVLVKRDREAKYDVSENIAVVSSLTEYSELIEASRKEGSSVTHVLDLDETLIDPKKTEESRQEAVIQAVLHDVRHSKPVRPRFSYFNGYSVIDTEGHFGRLTGGEVVSPDFSGHQATIYQTNGSLVKRFVYESDHRPRIPEWQATGGRRGVEALTALIKQYRQRLSDIRFPVPTDGHFMPAKDRDGRYFIFEVVPFLGSSMQEVFRYGSLEDKAAATRSIVEASHPVLIADGIGADLKPANWVRNGDGITHIDPLPVIMREERTDKVFTEWPRIDAPQIQQFLHDTHLTPMALGYRFYQELCQIDPKNRENYQSEIRSVLGDWVVNNKLSLETVQKIDVAIEPDSSRILTGVVNGDIDMGIGFRQVDDYITDISEDGSHPIYALREMGFLISSRILNNGYNMEDFTKQALHSVRDRLGEERFSTTSTSVYSVPQELWFATVVRKLTHLSHDDWKPDEGEAVALDIVKNATKELVYARGR